MAEKPPKNEGTKKIYEQATSMDANTVRVLQGREQAELENIYKDEAELEKIHEEKDLESQEVLDDLEEKAQAFADGNAREEDGKTFVRILLIPPVAMLFSLFFSAANLIEVLAGLCKFNPRISGALRHGFQMVLLGILVCLPVLMPSPITQKNSFKYFYDKTSETISPSISYASRWMITLQPILYPVGSASSVVTDRIAPINLKTDDQDDIFLNKAGD